MKRARPARHRRLHPQPSGSVLAIASNAAEEITMRTIKSLLGEPCCVCNAGWRLRHEGPPLRARHGQGRPLRAIADAVRAGEGGQDLPRGRGGRPAGAEAMIRISISVEAFAAIVKTLPVGSVGYENEANERGERTVWLEAARWWIFYSLPRRRCYARHGVDRPASRHAGLRSLLPRPPQRSMEARPCSSQ